ncbi:MAG: hypothetical protein SF029_26550 [bacterium]|nr:hypothetical protein [bacterium]
MVRRLDFTLICVLFVLALLIRLRFITASGFDGLYGQDAYAYYDFASAVVRGEAPGAFFWPLGYPTLLIAGMGVGGVDPLIGQRISLVMGAGLASLVFILARQFSVGRIGAFFAGLLVVFGGQAAQCSLVLMSDVPALFWCVLSAVALNIYFATDKSRWLAFAAFLLAFAGITRWLYLVLALPWTVSVLLHWRGRLRWRAALLGFAAVMIVLLPQWMYSRASPFPVLNHAWVEGWSLANFARHEFTNVDGHFFYTDVNALFYAQPLYNFYYLAPLFLPLVVLGVVFLIRTTPHSQTVLLIGWLVLPYLFLAGIPYQNMRFGLILVPAIVMLVGLGLNGILLTTRTFHPLLYRLAQAVMAGFVLVGIAQMNANGSETISAFITRQQEDKAIARWAAEQLPSGEHLYSFGLTLTLQHYTPLQVHEIYYETPQTLEQRWERDHADYLLLNVWNIQNQWNGREPQTVYHWFRDVRGLQTLGRYGNYTLFRVKG